MSSLVNGVAMHKDIYVTRRFPGLKNKIFCDVETKSYTEMSQEECARLREGVPYVKVYRYNPKHICPKLNGYEDNGQRILKL